MMPIAYLISFFIGYLLIGLIFDRNRLYNNGNDYYMHFTLSLPIGMGFSSLISFYIILLFGKADRLIFLLAHLLILFILLILNNRTKRLFYDIGEIVHRPINIKWLFVIVAILLFVFFRLLPFVIKYPYGMLDAISCWNLRARFILVSDNWLRAFSPTMTAIDYPLLLPLNILWGWLLAGQDSPVCPVLVAIIYTFSIILFLFGAIDRYFGRKKALLILLFLISVPSFLIVAITQYADIVLSCYNLIGLICCFIGAKENRRDYMILAELSLGFGALTKNEGLLYFIGVNLIMLFYFLLYRKSFIKILLLGLAASLLPLMTLGIFRQLIYNPHKMFFTEGVPLPLLFEKVLGFLLFIPGNIFKINLWSLFWYVFLAVSVIFYKKIFKGLRAIISFTIMFIFIGYFIIFILKVEPPLENLSFSYQRFIMHFLPLLCFLIADIIFEKNSNNIYEYELE